MRRNTPEECPTNFDVVLFELTTLQKKCSQKTIEIGAVQKSVTLPHCLRTARRQLINARQSFQAVAVIFLREDVIGLPQTLFF
ncbi:hypothetical protein A2881_00880 [Candidatus Peribacteria bacterium RIFCSPHIGHO2_01_FULL_55_13]|nr:MAG: hypothetical protein A2881_00880 [Candidatus Peribacteria bacterium RIFCSPHIGHO2_01_FULL_55_13]